MYRKDIYDLAKELYQEKYSKPDLMFDCPETLNIKKAVRLWESLPSPSTQLLFLVYCVSVSKVAHHGSKTSTSPAFLAAVDPEVAVICVGRDNPFGHPSAEVVDRLIDRLGDGNVYRTDQDGTIEFITDGEMLWVRSER